jgi:hypothetical protein
VSQAFSYPANRPYLAFDAAFVRNGAAADAEANDWMSVEVTDGATTHCLFYRDSFSATPDVSARHGLPMTDVEHVFVDLQALFPASDASTVFTLAVAVGNGGDGLAPSLGYVDAFEHHPLVPFAPKRIQGPVHGR